jgi:3-oxoacyl-[acyl-carrier protein] reductase
MFRSGTIRLCSTGDAMDFGLRGRTALVGGSSSGLGRASAEALAAEGCDLVLWSRRADALAATASELHAAHGVRIETVAADATDAGAAEAVAEAALAVGPIDIVVLNSGGPPTVDPTATDPDAWRRAFQLLAVTPIELATRLLPGMRDRRWGRVISILSSGVRQPIPELVYSNANRSALAAWLKTTARAVAGDGVTVNGVMPGRLSTPRIHELDSGRAELEGVTEERVRAGHVASIPAGRYGRPEELGAVVAFLGGTHASYVTGQLIAVDGGLIAGL